MSDRAPRRSDRLRDLLPHGVVRRVQHQRAVAAKEAADAARQQARLERLRRAEQAAAAGDALAWDYEAAVSVLIDRGLDEDEIRGGSMPEASLQRCDAAIRELLGDGGPIRALHVGNFLGVSLAAVTATVRAVDPGSVVVAVDPDVAHRGIERPAAHAMALLRSFGLDDAVLPITAYSLGRNLGNDGLDEHDHGVSPWQAMEESAAAAQALPRLADLAPGGFDLVLLDGNHDASYLSDELTVVARLLRPGGILVLDDVDAGAWSDIQAVFDGLVADDGGPFRRVDADGRIGVALRA